MTRTAAEKRTRWTNAASADPRADLLAFRESEADRIVNLTLQEKIARLRAEYTSLRIAERGSVAYWHVVSALRAMGVEVTDA